MQDGKGHGDGVEDDVAAELEDAHLLVVEAPLDVGLGRRPQDVDRHADQQDPQREGGSDGPDEGFQTRR